MTIQLGSVVKINVELLEESGWDSLTDIKGIVDYIKNNENKEFVVDKFINNPSLVYNIGLDDEVLDSVLFNKNELIII